MTMLQHVVIINDTKPCACLMALLTKIMRCILQVRAQEQPGTCPTAGTGAVHFAFCIEASSQYILWDRLRMESRPTFIGAHNAHIIWLNKAGHFFVILVPRPLNIEEHQKYELYK